METVKLAEVTRGELVESVHRGAVAVVNREECLRARKGDPGLITYMRSAAKPIQAIPLVESGIARHFGLTSEEIAIITSSHSGEEEHVNIILDILRKIGLTAGYLKCGSQMPMNGASARNLLSKGLSPTVLHCTCSGKHTGMLALARYHSWELENYYQLAHPVQQAMLRVIADFASVAPEEIPVGVDGCGVPVFALALEKMALTYARLVDPAGFADKRKNACQEITAAMTSHPQLVAGTGRLASELMKVTQGRLVAKDGVEGIFCMGAKGLGIAIKIEDGNQRAMGPIVISVLKQLGLLEKEELEQLADQAKVTIKNLRGEIVGEIRPAFSLE